MKSIRNSLSGLLLLLAFLVPLCAHAGDRGRMSLGLAAGYASYNDGGYLTVNYQYSFADHFRIAPDLGYVFRNEGKSAFILDVDMHFPFRVAKGFALYPLAGLTLNNWDYKYDGHATRFGGNIGAGMELNITNYFKISLQGKYSFMKDTGGAFVGLGLHYCF